MSKLIGKDVNLVCTLLQEGNVVAIPTDTVFGLACIFDCEQAINYIKEIKGREQTKSLPMMVDSIEKLQQYGVCSSLAKKLCQQYMPGAFTIIVPSKNIASYVNDGKDTIAIRIPNDEFLLKVLKQLKKPILMTSANLSGQMENYNASDVQKIFNHKLKYVVEGSCNHQKASTIVDASSDEIKIIRQGDITINLNRVSNL